MRKLKSLTPCNSENFTGAIISQNYDGYYHLVIFENGEYCPCDSKDLNTKKKHIAEKTAERVLKIIYPKKNGRPYIYEDEKEQISRFVNLFGNGGLGELSEIFDFE